MRGRIKMKAFRVQGRFRMGRRNTKFTIETIGDDEAAARERVLSTIGSRHRVDRNHIRVEDVSEVSADDLTDAVLQKRIAMVK